MKYPTGYQIVLRSNAVENKQLKICGRSTFTVAGNLVHNCLITEINDYAALPGIKQKPRIFHNLAQ